MKAKVYRKWLSDAHMFAIGCESCGWRDVATTSAKAGQMIDRHAKLNHNDVTE